MLVEGGGQQEDDRRVEDRHGAGQTSREHGAPLGPELVVGGQDFQAVVRTSQLAVELTGCHDQGQQRGGGNQSACLMISYVVL